MSKLTTEESCWRVACVAPHTTTNTATLHTKKIENIQRRSSMKLSLMYRIGYSLLENLKTLLNFSLQKCIGNTIKCKCMQN